jgi:hypothetical protein
MSVWNAFEDDKPLVLEKLREGFVEHLEVVSRVAETQFFQKFIGSGDMERLASTFPTPRTKEEVPLWLYLSNQITLRLHGSAAYSSLPRIVHCGGLGTALAEQREVKEDPQSQSRQVLFKGYNQKADYPRTTPCDPDFVRKLAKDTDPDALEAWYGIEVARYFKDQGAYDPEGIFTYDGSYLFVPDNARYELSKRAVFDEHNHPISKEDEQKLTPTQRRRCRLRRYYQMASLCHLNRKQDFLLYTGARLLRGEGHEVKTLVPAVDRFVGAAGKGVMKILLIDRGFIDGESIGKIKKEHEVDVVVPLKAKMDITEDAWKLAEIDGGKWEVWKPPEKKPLPDPPQRPESIRRAEKARQKKIARDKKDKGVKPPPRLDRVELKLIPRMTLWKECPVPLDVVLMREYMTDGETSQWGLMTTREVVDPLDIRDLYHLRTSHEEGWRQSKCYWDLTGFRSCSFPLVVNQVVFVLMSYSLLQLFLLQSDRGDLAKVTRERLLAELIPDGDKVAVYWKNRVGYFSLTEYSDILLNLAEGARRRLQGTVRRLRKSQLEPPALPRPT